MRRPVGYRSRDKILITIAMATLLHGGASFTRSQLAHEVGISIETAKKSLFALRREGLVESEAQHDRRGAQLANRYRATDDGLLMCFGLSARGRYITWQQERFKVKNAVRTGPSHQRERA